MAIGGRSGLLDNTHPALRRCWHPVARSAEIGEQPVRVVLLGEPYVCFRAGKRLVAFVDRCPHRLAPLSAGSCAGGELACAYHGWRFDSTGRCTAIPALGAGAALPPRARLRPAGALAERYGVVFLAPDEPLVPLPTIAEAEAAEFEAGELEPTTARAGAGFMADNFLDFAHFPFLHRGTFGAEESAEVAPYAVDRDGFGFTVVYEHPFANREDPGVAAGLRPLVQTRRMTYRYYAPFSLSLRLEFLEAGGVNTIGFFIQPETAETTRLYTTMWRNDLGGDAERMTSALAFEQQVLDEDLALASRYEELALPIDSTVEVHTRADRITLELRRVLADLVSAASAQGPPQPVAASPAEDTTGDPVMAPVRREPARS